MANNGGLDAVNAKKNDQGHHECEVLGPGPEAEESAWAWGRCTKNPGHSTFIPAPELSLEHLPEGTQDENVLGFVRSISARTVKLSVGYISLARPDGYMFSSHRGSSIVHTGSGLIHQVRHGVGPCPCGDCGGSPSADQSWYKIWVSTACHVVYDAEEALRTKVDLFYDDDTARVEGRMKTLWGIDIERKDEKGDTCTLFCITHDENLASLLSTPIALSSSFLTRNPDDWPEACSNLCVIVSHPHGQPKKVTFGRLRYEGYMDALNRRSRFTYTTDTCSGSSGALVLAYHGDWPNHNHAQIDGWWTALHSLGAVHGQLNQSGRCDTLL